MKNHQKPYNIFYPMFHKAAVLETH